MDVASTPPDDDVAAAIRAVAAEQPRTVAQARALIADPDAAHASGEDERAVAWLVALAARRIRRCGGAWHGGGHAA